ncbi:class I SAM-dependent methyltransferase [Paenibacillus tundrae]|uniref:S-adenosyl-L-methionine-dependent methyltransferase n=1 Tax=Paenibacillus tundrae TaxID=528187 RepID=A0ABT9WH12_9BACL|nr:class I SAM-dependent methyltransferase [Paenibacillus tundrae]MDQ0172554.1 methyltransferase (TIGR00027 family) [Paenibacillus tundrae]
MKHGQVSITSLVSAFSRAYHSQYDVPCIFNDSLAKELLSPQEHSEIRNNMIQGMSFFDAEMAGNMKDDPDVILKWIVQVQLAPTPLARAAYCERVLLHEVTLGATQYVILGAGLDTFAFRHRELSTTLRIFELDTPATQESKQSRLVQANWDVPANLTFVPMDFTLPLSVQAMMNAGFSDHHKTFFSLLGVSYYLTKEDLSNLLRRIFAVVPSGSSIVFDYPDEHLFEEKGISNRVQNMIQMAAVGGESIQACYTYAEMEKLLAEAGLLIYEHLSPIGIQEQFFSNRTDDLSAFESVHYIHAVKR